MDSFPSPVSDRSTNRNIGTFNFQPSQRSISTSDNVNNHFEHLDCIHLQDGHTTQFLKRPIPSYHKSYKRELVKRYCLEQAQSLDSSTASSSNSLGNSVILETSEIRKVRKIILGHLDFKPYEVKYVILEDFKCPCFFMAGEPFLVTPLLLKFLQQRFSLLRIVKIIEDLEITFLPATYEQMASLRTFILAPSYWNCPLIKYSDADRLVQELYEQCFKNKPPRDPNIYRKQYEFAKAAKLNRLQDYKNKQTQPSNLLPTGSSTIDDQNISSSPICYLSLQPKPPAHESTQHQRLPLLTGESSSSQLRDIRGNLKRKDFNHQKQNVNVCREQIEANKSRNAIRIYHNCFGKTTGLFYPHLLQISDYRCIECVACGRILDPKRFIGHVHSPKERNVCHWGFNSSNWRYYIQLCENQSSNNFSNEQLVEHLRKLRKLRYANCSAGNYYEFDKIDSAEQLRQLIDCQQDLNYDTNLLKRSLKVSIDKNLANYRPSREQAAPIIIASTCTLIESYSTVTTNAVITSYTLSSPSPKNLAQCNDILQSSQDLLSRKNSTLSMTGSMISFSNSPANSLENYMSGSFGNSQSDNISIYNQTSSGIMSTIQANHNHHNQPLHNFQTAIPQYLSYHDLTPMKNLPFTNYWR